MNNMELHDICILPWTPAYFTQQKNEQTPLLFGTFKRHPRVSPETFSQVSCSKPSSGVVWSCYGPIFRHNSSPTKKSAETQTSQRSSENVVTLTRILMGTGYCCIFWNGWHGFAIFPMSSLHIRPVISGVTCDMDTSTVPCITRKSVLTASRLRQVVDKEEYIHKKTCTRYHQTCVFLCTFPFHVDASPGSQEIQELSHESLPVTPFTKRLPTTRTRWAQDSTFSGREWLKTHSPGILVNESLIKSIPTSDKGYSEYSRAPTLCITITN